MTTPDPNEMIPLAPATSCCVHLRCKSMFYRPDERPGMLHNEEAMGYWCHHTNHDQGPDHGPTHHEDCQAHRPCYQAGPRNESPPRSNQT